jgi:hypothetical protein
MDDLIQWLHEQLKEDERIAREAGNRRWLVQDNIIELYPEREDDGFMSWPTRSDAHHAATWEPERVLREVEVARELLAEYERVLTAHATHQREVARIGEQGDTDPIRHAALRREADYLPAMLHVLERWAKRKAAVYADRPGYREEWRP